MQTTPSGRPITAATNKNRTAEDSGIRLGIGAGRLVAPVYRAVRHTHGEGLECQATTSGMAQETAVCHATHMQRKCCTSFLFHSYKRAGCLEFLDLTIRWEQTEPHQGGQVRATDLLLTRRKINLPSVSNLYRL